MLDDLSELKNHAERMSLLNEMSQQISLAITEDEVFKITANYTYKIFKADRVGVALLTDSDTKLEAFALAGENGRIPMGVQVLAKGTLVGLAINENRIIVTPDLSNTSFPDSKMLAEIGLRSAMNCPLVTGGKVIGTLNIVSKEINLYKEKDEKLALQMASILASNIQNRRLVNKLQNAIIEVEEEQKKSEKLLLNILPKDIVRELKEKGSAEPVLFESVSVMFTDFKGFTQIAEKLTPQELVKDLDACFVQFDKITERYNLEKLKTIGDSYMCAGGIPKINQTHAIDSCLAALEIQAFMNIMKKLKEEKGFPYWELRLGIHSGPLVAGVIGERKFAYDVWGDTVNTASRMESSGTPGRINISYTTYEFVKDFFECEYRGEVSAKNKGVVKMYYLNRLKSEFSKDNEGIMPNGNFLERYN